MPNANVRSLFYAQIHGEKRPRSLDALRLHPQGFQPTIRRQCTKIDVLRHPLPRGSEIWGKGHDR